MTATSDLAKRIKLLCEKIGAKEAIRLYVAYDPSMSHSTVEKWFRGSRLPTKRPRLKKLKSFMDEQDQGPPRAPVEDPQPPQPAVEHASIERIAVGLILALGPLAEALASDAFSAKDRERIRKLTGGDGIFKLKNALARLCGERARATLGGNL